MNWSEIVDHINKIDGYFEGGQDIALFSFAKEVPDDGVIIEIGSFKGKSTSCLAAGCFDTNKIVYAIDPFKNQPNEEYKDNIWTYNLTIFKNNLRNAGLLKYVKPIKGYSQDIGKDWSIECDMLFIDGAHTYEGCLSDFELYFKWLKPNGILAMHDVMQGSPWAGVLRVWQEEALPRLHSIQHVGSLAVGRKS